MPLKNLGIDFGLKGRPHSRNSVKCTRDLHRAFRAPYSIVTRIPYHISTIRKSHIIPPRALLPNFPSPFSPISHISLSSLPPPIRLRPPKQPLLHPPKDPQPHPLPCPPPINLPQQPLHLPPHLPLPLPLPIPTQCRNLPELEPGLPTLQLQLQRRPADLDIESEPLNAARIRLPHDIEPAHEARTVLLEMMARGAVFAAAAADDADAEEVAAVVDGQDFGAQLPAGEGEGRLQLLVGCFGKVGGWVLVDGDGVAGEALEDDEGVDAVAERGGEGEEGGG